MATNGRGGAKEGETNFIAVVVKCADLIKVKYSAWGLLFGGWGGGGKDLPVSDCQAAVSACNALSTWHARVKKGADSVTLSLWRTLLQTWAYLREM